MNKPTTRAYSRYAREAVSLLGCMIRAARTERRMTIAEVAERAGVSPGLVHRIEKGSMSSSIGVALEIAAIVGVRLFDAKPDTLSRYLSMTRDKLALLPKSARRRSHILKDDF